MTDPTTTSDNGAVFGFDDLKALREEYEERIRVMKLEHEQRITSEGASRQELITDLTFELAAAREDGELRMRAAQARGSGLEGELRSALESVCRIEAELLRVKLALSDALSPTGETRLPAATTPTAPTVELPIDGSDVIASAPDAPDAPGASRSAPPAMPVDPTPATTAAGARRKKIRLR